MPKAKKKTTVSGTTVTTQRAPSRAGGAVVVVREGARKVARAVQTRRRSGAAGMSLQKSLLNAGVGGAALGFLEKTFGDQIPAVPLIGRKGTVALAVYFLKPKSQLLRDVGMAAAVLSGYQLTKEGKIDGEGDEYASNDYED